MDLFGRIKKKESLSQRVDEYFRVIDGYIPSFTSFEGGLYEMELTRAAIHAFAVHVSKLKPELKGVDDRELEHMLQYKPNSLMDTKKYLYRLATIYSVDNNAIIAPLYGPECGRISGLLPMVPEYTRIVDYDGVKWLRYDFGGGRYGAVEFESCGILNQYQYKNNIWGESNVAMRPTLELLHTQNEGIIEGIKNAASIRFFGRLTTNTKPKDIEAERERFKSDNLGTGNNGGIILVDTKYSELKQIDSRPFVVNPQQMAQIKENVFNYFGCNEGILQNKYTSDEWNAYYEGKVEPFALEASLVHTDMLSGNLQGGEVVFTANRMQYLSNSEKLNTVTQLFDRGFLTHNQGLEIFNMAGIGPEGDKRFIRKEYAETDAIEKELMNSAEGGPDTIPPV